MTENPLKNSEMIVFLVRLILSENAVENGGETFGSLRHSPSSPRTQTAPSDGLEEIHTFHSI
jgi:hypothetical protein